MPAQAPMLGTPCMLLLTCAHLRHVCGYITVWAATAVRSFATRTVRFMKHVVSTVDVGEAQGEHCITANHPHKYHLIGFLALAWRFGKKCTDVADYHLTLLVGDAEPLIDEENKKVCHDHQAMNLISA